ncbi:hypothetical protein TNCV_3212171 [Trichonephila clavipes]|nr:hypothetical protein TNCV_3212151 [Trichonephila clavipes]GFT18982.1 hypothetical protein TNCV_3212171 [Trichonephila clavipes]
MWEDSNRAPSVPNASTLSITPKRSSSRDVYDWFLSRYRYRNAKEKVLYIENAKIKRGCFYEENREMFKIPGKSSLYRKIRNIEVRNIDVN